MTNKEWLDYLAHNAPDELAAWFDSEHVETANATLHGDTAALERKIAERYMELPVDMNEEPIHPGDLMTSTAFDRNAIDGKEHVFAVNYDFWVDKDNCTHIPAETRHVKLRTIEDVLREFGKAYTYVDGECASTTTLIADYADELRGMGVGE